MTYADTVQADSPIVYFRLETATAYDTVSASNKTLIGTPSVVTGKVDNGWSLNGTQAITLGWEFTDYTAGTFSIESWFKIGPSTKDYPTLWRRDGGGSTVLLRVRGSGVASPGLMEIYLNGVSAYSPNRCDNNQWHHVVLSVGSGSAKVYIDAVEVISVSVGSLSIPNAGSRGHAVFSGSESLGGVEEFNGSVDEFAIYNQKLSLGQVQAHFNSANALPVGPAKSVTTNAVANMKSMATQPRLTLSAVVTEPKYISIGKQALLTFAAVGGRLETSAKAPKVLSSKQCKLVMFAADKCSILYGLAVPVETPLVVLNIDAPMERKIDKLSMYGNKLDVIVARKEL